MKEAAFAAQIVEKAAFAAQIAEKAAFAAGRPVHPALLGGILRRF